jgi:fatty acid-binding protein DegV
MKKVCLVVDSSSGIKNGEYPDVHVLPLGITAPDGQTFKDEVEITVGQIIANMLEKNIMYKTSQPNPGDALNLFDKLSKEHEEVLVLPLPASLSNAYNTLKMLAADFNNVRVFEQDMIVQLTR